jgi:hypothetical protein
MGFPSKSFEVVLCQRRDVDVDADAHVACRPAKAATSRLGRTNLAVTDILSSLTKLAHSEATQLSIPFFLLRIRRCSMGYTVQYGCDCGVLCFGLVYYVVVSWSSCYPVGPRSTLVSQSLCVLRMVGFSPTFFLVVVG